jgi:hypothetical protein
MNFNVDKLLDRTSLALVVIGIVVIIIAALGVVPFTGSTTIIEPTWRIVVGVFGGVFVIMGLFLIWREQGGSLALNSKGNTKDGVFAPPDKMKTSGLKNAFRIPVDNPKRVERVKQMVADEGKKQGSLRLLASSGYSYLNHNGQVWNDAKLGDLLINGSIKMQAILESPFSDFAVSRALANQLDSHQWQEKQKIESLIELLKYPNISLRVTDIPVNCSLFFTSKEVFYDPYLWPKRSGKRTENNFWVFEFSFIEDPDFDCYSLLGRHFDFCLENSIPLEDFIYTPEDGEKKLLGQDFYYTYKTNPDKYLASYLHRSDEFKTKMRKLLGWTK